MSKLETLVRDIYNFIEDPTSELSEDNLQVFLENVGDHLRKAFGKFKTQEKTLRASNLGLPDRRLWYSVKAPNKGMLPAANAIQFLYGNILEELVLLLAREAGHEVTSEQKSIQVNGVKGHTDARIDGVVTDIKSASKYSFEKYRTGEFMLPDESLDPFGYKAQLGMYAAADGDKQAALLPINKENGELVVLLFDAQQDLPDVPSLIEHKRNVLERDTPPEEKCYPDEARGKSGNRVIAKLCTFCEFKDRCWADANDGKGLISHTYADGKVYFTRIIRDPRKKNDEEIVEES